MIGWMDFAALQCDVECSTYTPCLATCPAVTCSNPFGATALCKTDTCVEGCQLQACPVGHIRRNPSETACIPLAECPGAVCLHIDGVNYAEGQLIEEDECHSWYIHRIHRIHRIRYFNPFHSSYCSKNQKICQGQPCVDRTTMTLTTTPTTPTTTPESMAISACVSGWSGWINANHPKSGADAGDREFLPDILQPVTD